MGVVISLLPEADSLAGNEIVPVVQSGQTVRTTVSAIQQTGAPNHSYYDTLCALLEPDAYEYPRYGTWTYTVASGETKHAMLLWQTKIGSAGRVDIRDPRGSLPLRGVTVTGLGADSTGAFIDPSLPVYTDSWNTYHDRMQQIATLPTRSVDLEVSESFAIFLPGPYGSIVTSVSNFNFAWTALGYAAKTGYGNCWAIDNELGDFATDSTRFAHHMTLPINKAMVNRICTGEAGGIGTARSTITFINCPSGWSCVPDTTNYLFRDDFMGTSLDTTVNWTRTQSSAGNVEIYTNFQWLRMLGNGNWGANGVRSKIGHARANGKVLLVDVNCGDDNGGGAANHGFFVGWTDGAGVDVANFTHAVLFGSGKTLRIYEDGALRATVGAWDTQITYRVRITLTTTGAIYEIQGGDFGPIGSSWTTLDPVTSSSADATLYPGTSVYGGRCYLSDFRVY
jgi:hypothetical protein